MPLFRQFQLSGVDILVWKITETVDELLQMVPADCASFALEKFASKKRCSEWLAVRALLAQKLDNVRVVYDAVGKPSLDGCCGNISISHTDGYAVVALSRNYEIGVDVESLSRDIMSLSHRFMPAESFNEVLPGKRNFVALVHWCAKEALFKIVGNLGGNFKDNILVGAFEPQEKGSVQLSLFGVESAAGANFVADYSVVDSLLFVLCRRLNNR